MSVGDLVVDPGHDLLLGPGFPDTVTSHDNELILCSQLYFLNLRKGDDELLLGLQLLVLLVLKISQGSGEVEVAVDSSVTDEATGLLDTVLLLNEIWFVVLAQEDGLVSSSQNGSGVTCVGDVQCVLVE